MIKIAALATLCALLGASPAAHALEGAELPVVGLDRHHKEFAVSVSEQEYSGTLGRILTTVHDSALSALDEHERASSDRLPELMLRDVCVGVGLNFTIGLGPIYSVSAAPRVRMTFSNSTHPISPD
jgi:hypothetical protein